MAELATAPESLFWYWIAERHAIHLRRANGEPKPWTKDPILRDYKFTNPFRENDRGTVWLRKNFLEPYRYADDSLLAFNICWYRMFNWTGTGEALGWQREIWDVDRANDIKTMLYTRLSAGLQVFTGAHIVYSRPGYSKIDAIVEVCRNLGILCRSSLFLENLHKHRSLQETFTLLRTVDSVGGFMAYEMVSDMRHTKLLKDAHDINTWANPGPGAKRGLKRLQLVSSPDWMAIEEMKALLERSNDGIFNVKHPDGRPLHEHWPGMEMRDIEHSLCEFDKYCRVKFGEGEPRSKFNGAA